MQLTLNNVKQLFYAYINCSIFEKASGYNLTAIKNDIMGIFLNENSEHDLLVKECFENNDYLKLYSML